MGHIKEPKGVDFIIKSEPLTAQERSDISKFIQTYKLNNSKKKVTVAKKKTAITSRKKAFA